MSKAVSSELTFVEHAGGCGCRPTPSQPEQSASTPGAAVSSGYETVDKSGRCGCCSSYYRSVWDRLCQQLFGYIPAGMDTEQILRGLVIWKDDVVLVDETIPATFRVTATGERKPLVTDIIYYKEHFYNIGGVTAGASDVYTCTECLPIEASVIEVYKTLVATNARLEANEIVRRDRANQDHDRADADHDIASADHQQYGDDHFTAGQDHAGYEADHDRAASDHLAASGDRSRAADDHAVAGADHSTAQEDHARAGNDHSRAESDHSRAEQDHRAVANAVLFTPQTLTESEQAQARENIGVEGTGTDTEAVHYTPQSLTDAQKAQARTNIGATAPEVFWAEYGVTTREEVESALTNGKLVYTEYQNRRYYHTGKATNNAILFNVIDGDVEYRVIITAGGVWSNTFFRLEQISNKSQSVPTDRASTTKYPSVKAVADALAPKYEKPQTGIPANDLADGVIPDISGKADKVQSATAGHLAGLNAGGNPTDTGLVPLDIPLFPNMDGLTPVQTIEYDLTKNEWCKLFERINPEGTVASDVTEVIACRVTVTGDNMVEPQVIDIVATGPGRLDRQFFAVFRALTPDISAANKYGIFQLRTSCPKALGSGYGWVFDFNPSYAVRHIKVEVFKTAPTVVFYSEHTKTNTSSTYHSVGASPNADGTKLFNNIENNVNGSCTSAAYITEYLMPLLSTVIQTGEAIISNQICFIGADGKAYPVSNMVQAINPDAFVFVAGSNYAINKDISTAYLRTITSFSLSATTNPNVTIPQFVKGDQLFLRCHIANGAIYSDAVITTAISPGYTWIALGYAASATSLALSTHGKEFFTLDANGKLTHVNGREIAVPASGVQDVTLGGTSVVSGGVAVLPAYPTVPTIESMTAQEVTTAVDTAWGNVMGS